MGKKSSKSPDTVGGAREEGKQNRQAQRDQIYADRPNQYNPWGSIEWESQYVDAQGNPIQGDPYAGGRWNKKKGAFELPPGVTERWTQRQNLSEGAQDLYDKTEGMMRGRLGLAEGLMGRMEGEMGAPVDWDQFGDVIDYDSAEARQAAEDAAYQKSANRLDPQFAKQQEQMEIDLRNKGLRPGDPAYDSAVASFQTGRNDAYEQARLGSSEQGRMEAELGMGQNQLSNQLRQQKIEEYLGKRGYTLDQINQLTQGQTAGDLAGMISGGGTAPAGG
jgi:hypothetical protein